MFVWAWDGFAGYVKWPVCLIWSQPGCCSLKELQVGCSVLVTHWKLDTECASKHRRHFWTQEKWEIEENFLWGEAVSSSYAKENMGHNLCSHREHGCEWEKRENVTFLRKTAAGGNITICNSKNNSSMGLSKVRSLQQRLIQPMALQDPRGSGPCNFVFSSLYILWSEWLFLKFGNPVGKKNQSCFYMWDKTTRSVS